MGCTTILTIFSRSGLLVPVSKKRFRRQNLSAETTLTAETIRSFLNMESFNSERRQKVLYQNGEYFNIIFIHYKKIYNIFNFDHNKQKEIFSEQHDIFWGGDYWSFFFRTKGQKCFRIKIIYSSIFILIILFQFSDIRYFFFIFVLFSYSWENKLLPGYFEIFNLWRNHKYLLSQKLHTHLSMFI